jgi:GH24 family phage-related lysozyme (muramidase)
MLNSFLDKRRKKMMLEQGNPELNVADPGVKRQRKALGNPDFDFSETREGVRRIQNDSENKSKDDSNIMLAYTGGWGEILNEVFASENESPELSKKREELGIKTTQNTSLPDKEGSKTPSNLVEFIIELEDFSPTAYDDFKQTSIGYGTKATSKKQTITEPEARELMKKDLDAARKTVLKLKETAGYDWNENQVDALTSFTYNLGAGNLRKLTDNGTRGDEEIADMLPEYKYAGKKVRDGLVKRRAEELRLFNEGY